MPVRALTAAIALTGALATAACTAAPPQDAAPVRTITVHQHGDAVTNATVPAATKAPYKLYYVTLPDRTRVAARFNPCQSITYKVNLSSVPTSKRAKALAVTKTSFARISKATGLKFAYKGSTSLVPTPEKDPHKQSAEIVVAWTKPSKTRYPLGGWTAGYGGYSLRSWSETKAGKAIHGAAITRGFVVIDTPDALDTRMFTQGSGRGSTLVNLVTHEIGHVVGLQHVNSSTQLMNPSLSRSTPDGPAAGDRAGLAKIGRSAGCISIPSWVATDLR